MAQRKLAPKPTAKDLAQADRVRRARMAQPPRDPTGEHHEAVAELAHRLGLDVCDLLEDWDYRASIREYDGNISRADAERLAVEDVRALHERQESLL